MGTQVNKAHDIEEYMKQVELWFLRYEMIHNRRVKRQIYVASDTVEVVFNVN